MAVTLLKEIASIEQKAEQVELKAQQKAREIIASAKKNAADQLRQREEKAEVNAKEIIKAQELKAFDDIKNMQAEIRAKGANIRKKAGTKLDEAVGFIVGRIVKNSGR